MYVSRYKVLFKDHGEFLKLWPGYVYWARGQVKLALSAFSTALNSLKYGKHTSNLWLGWTPKKTSSLCVYFNTSSDKDFLLGHAPFTHFSQMSQLLAIREGCLRNLVGRDYLVMCEVKYGVASECRSFSLVCTVFALYLVGAQQPPTKQFTLDCKEHVYCSQMLLKVKVGCCRHHCSRHWPSHSSERDGEDDAHVWRPLQCRSLLHQESRGWSSHQPIQVLQAFKRSGIDMNFHETVKFWV